LALRKRLEIPVEPAQNLQVRGHIDALLGEGRQQWGVFEPGVAVGRTAPDFFKQHNQATESSSIFGQWHFLGRPFRVAAAA